MTLIKRIFDIIVSTFTLIVLSPLILILVILVRIKFGSPVFFKQKRPGLHAKPFYMIKFRTMINKTDKNGHPLPDKDRVTNFGLLLRSTSLDEIPELWNVLKGEMSLVGPRPLLMEYLDYYTPREARRHEAKPGITGLAQISGRNAITWEDKLNKDVQYVEEHNFLLDLKIIAKTFKKVFAREDILQNAPQGALNKYRENEKNE